MKRTVVKSRSLADNYALADSPSRIGRDWLARRRRLDRGGHWGSSTSDDPSDDEFWIRMYRQSKSFECDGRGRQVKQTDGRKRGSKGGQCVLAAGRGTGAAQNRYRGNAGRMELKRGVMS